MTKADRKRIDTIEENRKMQRGVDDIQVVNGKCYVVLGHRRPQHHGACYRPYMPPVDVFHTGEVLVYERESILHPILIFNCLRGRKSGKLTTYYIDNSDTYHKTIESVYLDDHEIRTKSFRLPNTTTQQYAVQESDYIVHHDFMGNRVWKYNK